MDEAENPHLKALVSHPLTWVKLTHKDADPAQLKAVSTYELQMKLDLPEEALKAENFFWMSAYQFDQVTAKYPELLNRTHCCGAGQTYQALTKRLVALGKNKPYLFLNEAHWKNHTETT